MRKTSSIFACRQGRCRSHLRVGCIARSAPGWSLLVRGVANLSSSASYQMFKASSRRMIGSAPYSTTLWIIKTDIPIEFRSDVPFLQVQPVHKDVYAENLDQVSRENWEASIARSSCRTSIPKGNVANMPFRCAKGPTIPHWLRISCQRQIANK